MTPKNLQDQNTPEVKKSISVIQVSYMTLLKDVELSVHSKKIWGTL